MMALTVKNLSVFYDRQAVLENISFSVDKGEILAIVGPSGCGKTTLLNTIAGFIKPSQGQVQIDKHAGQLPFSYVFQSDALLPWRTVLENLRLADQILNKTTPMPVIVKALEEFHLSTEVLNKYPKALSGGMRQRISIMQNLLADPSILLLDEPFSSLDFTTKLKLENDFYALIKQSNKAAIIVTHDLDGALAMATKVIVLSGQPSTISKELVPFEQEKQRPTPETARTHQGMPTLFDALWSVLKQAREA